jgi:hypothetical protein
VFPTVTGDEDVPIPGPDACVPAGQEIRVTAVAGEPDEPARKPETVALCDAARPANVPACTLVLVLADGLASQFV